MLSGIKNIMKKILITDLKKQYQNIKPEIDRAIFKVIKSQRFVLGPETEMFEKKFANFCGKKYALGLGSGTEALYLALMAIGLKRGDEVIVPAFTFGATAEAVSFLGGSLKFCDIDSKTGLIDTRDLKRKISKKTKFVIPVHLYGQLAPIDKISKIIQKKGIKILEDAAQAHGAKKKNKMAPIRTIAAYSFYPSKNLGAFGDAGAIVTSTKKAYKKALFLRNHGQKKSKKYYHYTVGGNFRIDEIQAAVLNVKLKYLNSFIKKRRVLAKIYDQQFSKIKEIKPLKTLADNYHVYHLYAIKAERRNLLKKFLEKNKIESRVHYPIALHQQPAYKNLGYKKGDFPGAETLCQQVLCLPLYPELTKKEVLFITNKVKKFY